MVVVSEFAGSCYKLMHGRRSLGSPLLPFVDNINRMTRLPTMRDSPRGLSDLEIGSTSSSSSSEGPDQEMDRRMMKEFSLPTVGSHPSAILLDDAQRNYELKNLHYNTLPHFGGALSEDCLQFMKEYYSVVTTFPLRNLTEDHLRMRCFSYCMRDDAKKWLMALPAGSLTTWSGVEQKFFAKYFPSWKTKEIRSMIADFQENEGDAFHESWGRFKLLLAQCPHHEYTLVSQVQSFYDGLTGLSQAIVDNACGGAMREKTAQYVFDKYEMLEQNSQQRNTRGIEGE